MMQFFFSLIGQSHINNHVIIYSLLILFLFPSPPPPLSPAHPLAEVVDLSVCILDDNGEQKTLYKTQFAFVTDQKQYMAQLLLGSVSNKVGGEGEGEGGGGGSEYPIFPPLPSAEALREYDQSLADALMDSDLPPGWTLVGYNNHNTINSVQGMLHMYINNLFSDEFCVLFSFFLKNKISCHTSRVDTHPVINELLFFCI